MLPITEEQILREHDASDVSWTVTRRDDLLVKEYRVHQLRAFAKGTWRREYKALLRLNQRGVPSPRMYELESPRLGVIRSKRQFLDGKSVVALDHDQVIALGRHVAALHLAGVTNGDAALDNLLLADEGGLMFIDYGRSHVHHLESPLLCFNAGKELARIRRRLFTEGGHDWRVFLEAYFLHVVRPAWALALTRALMFLWLWRWHIPFDCSNNQSGMTGTRICGKT